MTIGRIQLRALVLPLGVAAFSAAALAWYGLVWVPAQQRYLNERNFRLLRTLSVQIKAKVDNFDLALDHTLESYDFARYTPEKLKQYVALFAPELEVLSQEDTDTREIVLNDAGDPPHVAVQRDEGRSYLYLGLRRPVEEGARDKDFKIAAKADLEVALGSFLNPGEEFDALLLVDRNGQTILQRSPSGLELSRVDRLTDAAASVGGTGTGAASAQSTFKALWMSSNSANVEIGDAAYRLYVQPIPLSLIRVDAKRAAASAAAVTAPGEPEEWALCGLVRTDKFRAASAAISYTYLLWFSAALVAIFLAIPLMKLRMLRARERLRRGDGVLVAASAFLVTGLLTFVLLDVYYFWNVFGDATDEYLQHTAEELGRGLQAEVGDIRALMDVLDSRLAEQKTLHNPQDSWPEDGPRIYIGDGGSACFPQPWVCERLLLKSAVTERGVYPYFDLVAWNDQNGEQQIKWTAARKLTPFINLQSEKIPYWDALKRAALATAPHDGIGVLVSPNTGTVVTAFWRAIKATEAERNDRKIRLGSQTLAMYRVPIAFDHPVLPPHVQFAVVERTGRVVFHSDGGRSLTENFLQETEDNAAIRALISSRHRAALSSYYHGRRHRLYVMPLTVPQFTDPGWSLIVFQESIIPETFNLETLTLAAALFAMFALVLAAVWAGACAISPRLAVKWFWPDERKGGRYQAVALVNGVLGVLFLAALFLPSTPLLLVSGILVATSLAATFAIVVRRDWPYASNAPWRTNFLWARLSLLFVVAAMPAVACFQAAYDYEMGLFVRSGQLHLAQSLDARNDLIVRRLEPLELQDITLNGYTDKDRSKNENAIGLLGFFGTRTVSANASRGAVALTPSRVDRVLQFIHRPYNSEAIDPESVFQGGSGVAQEPEWKRLTDVPATYSLTVSAPSGPRTLVATVPVAQPTAWYLLLVTAIVTALFLLLRYTVQPLYLLSRVRAVEAVDAAVTATATNRLLIGLPGAAATVLRNDQKIRTFDIRTAAFVERRRQLKVVANERRRVVGMPASVSSIFGVDWDEPREAPTEPKREEGGWAETFDYSSLPKDGDAIVGVEHLEHRFDEAAFRMQSLLFLEELVYRHERTLWVVNHRDPVEQLREAQHAAHATGKAEGAKEELAAELARWTKLLSSFTRVKAGLAPGEIHRAADGSGTPYFRAVWDACSRDEKIVLRQLADEGVVNPQSRAIVGRLMENGLVVRDRAFSISSDAFRRFVQGAASADQIRSWEHEGIITPWGTIAATVASLAFGLAGLLIFTQQQLLDAWIGFMPALAPILPKVVRWLADTQTGPKKANA